MGRVPQRKGWEKGATGAGAGSSTYHASSPSTELSPMSCSQLSMATSPAGRAGAGVKGVEGGLGVLAAFIERRRPRVTHCPLGVRGSRERVRAELSALPPFTFSSSEAASLTSSSDASLESASVGTEEVEAVGRLLVSTSPSVSGALDDALPSVVSVDLRTRRLPVGVRRKTGERAFLCTLLAKRVTALLPLLLLGVRFSTALGEKGPGTPGEKGPCFGVDGNAPVIFK